MRARHFTFPRLTQPAIVIVCVLCGAGDTLDTRAPGAAASTAPTEA